MKKILSTLALVCIGFLLGSCASTSGRGGSGQPDLVVTRLEKTGPPTVNEEGQVEVPLRVVVRNQGTGAADNFKTALEYQYHHRHGPYGVAFTVFGQEDPAYAWTQRPLAAKRKVKFSGKAVFPAAVRDVPVTLHAMADSCWGETSMPPTCRIAESSEDNNRSDPLVFFLP